MENIKNGFDYYYGIEAEQFSFYRVPRLLIKDERFKGLSSDAKLLYGLMLDRMSLSMKNGWLDSENRAYIIYTVDNMMDDLGCSKPTCIKIIRELDHENGIGLIEKIRRGLGKPDIIYVKNFATILEEKEGKDPENTDVSTEVKKLYFRKEKNFTSGGKESLLQEVRETDWQKESNFTSRSKESLPQEVKNLYPNYNNNNYTEMSYINPIYPINQSGENEKKTENSTRRDTPMEGVNAYMQLIRENIEYDHFDTFTEYGDRELAEELYQIICDVVCVKRKSIRIGGEIYPHELVKSRFLRLNLSHLKYVMGCMKNHTNRIENIRSYLITTLYNAPNTINHFYQQEVQHDMYG